MSLRSLTSCHEVQIEAVTTADDGALGRTETWTSVRSMPCRIRPLRARERAKYAAAGHEVSHLVYFSRDPGVDARHRLRFGKRILRDLRPWSVDEAERLWVIACRETSQLSE